MTSAPIPMVSTAKLVEFWKQYQTCQGDKSIVRAIELELHFRPVRERIAAGYSR